MRNLAAIKSAAALAMLCCAAAQAPSRWTFSSSVDAMSDQAIASARVSARSGSAAFSVRCDSASGKVVSLQYNAGTPLYASRGRVALRFDRDAPIEAYWEVHGSTVLTVEPREVNDLGARLGDASVLIARVYDGDRIIDATFDVAGAAPVIHSVLTACGYPDVLAAKG